jgi:hypothetical protein
MVAMLKFKIAGAIAVAALLLGTPGRKAGGAVLLQNGFCSVTVEPESLLVKMKDAGAGAATLVSAAQTNLGPVAHLVFDSTNAAWAYPDGKISISFALQDRVLHAHIQAETPREFTFPVISGTDSIRGWILPLFEGVYAPAGDTRWAAFLTHYGPMNTTADLILPFVGLDCGASTLTYIFENPFNNKLAFQMGPGKNLSARLTHQFTRNHPVKEYDVSVQSGGNSPVEPARLYRKWLMDRGQFVSFKDKIQRTPEAAKLLGAAHIYLWGGDILDAASIKDWRTFCLNLKEQGEASAPSSAKRVWSAMTPGGRAAVDRFLKEEWQDKYEKLQITSDLSRVLLLPDLAGDSGGSKPSGHTLSQAEISQANCKWLASAFPGQLDETETWGGGVSPNMIHQLAAAGLDRLWLGSDGWDGFVNHPETVAAARQAGFLIGPYDSFNSIHQPGEPDTWETAQFDPALYPSGAIINADGTPKRGFKHKGFTLSPDAARPYVEKRVANLMNLFHANSWFVDCDGFGDYFDDYSPQHPATQASDLQSRISRMEWICDTFGAVIGTEGCSAGVAPTVHFAHGVLTPVIGWGDPDLTNQKSKYYTGGYYPPDAPKNFFMPAPVKEEYRYIYYEPGFRLPLFQTVFHDSVIATHHWSSGSFKARDDVQTMQLLELLYNVPPLYHLNRDEFQKRKAQILRHYRFFSPLHRQLAEMPMTDFQWLTADRSVQLTTFGGQIDLVADFGATSFRFNGTTVPARSILARWRDGRPPVVFTP